MTGTEALRDLVVFAVVVVALAVWIEPLVKHHRAKRPREVPAPQLLTPDRRRQAQEQLDAAYEQAERQALAQAETGQGWAMPSRDRAHAAGCDGSHDDLAVSDADWALEVALLEDALNREERPSIAADTEPGAFDAW